MQLIKVTTLIVFLGALSVFAGFALPVSLILSISMILDERYVMGILLLVSFVGLYAFVDWAFDQLKKLLFARKEISGK